MIDIKIQCNTVSDKNNDMLTDKSKDIQSVLSKDFSTKYYDKRRVFSEKSRITQSTLSFTKKMEKQFTLDELDAIRQKKDLIFKPKIIEIK